MTTVMRASNTPAMCFPDKAPVWSLVPYRTGQRRLSNRDCKAPQNFCRIPLCGIHVHQVLNKGVAHDRASLLRRKALRRTTDMKHTPDTHVVLIPVGEHNPSTLQQRVRITKLPAWPLEGARIPIRVVAHYWVRRVKKYAVRAHCTLAPGYAELSPRVRDVER